MYLFKVTLFSQFIYTHILCNFYFKNSSRLLFFFQIILFVTFSLSIVVSNACVIYIYHRMFIYLILLIICQKLSSSVYIQAPVFLSCFNSLSFSNSTATFQGYTRRGQRRLVNARVQHAYPSFHFYALSIYLYYWRLHKKSQRHFLSTEMRLVIGMLPI